MGTWHDLDVGRPIAAPLEQCAELLDVDLAVVRELAAKVEPYLRADGTRPTAGAGAATSTADGSRPPMPSQSGAGVTPYGVKCYGPFGQAVVRPLGCPIHGTSLRTPLLGAFAADQRGITTTHSVPLLSPAVPWLMP